MRLTFRHGCLDRFPVAPVAPGMMDEIPVVPVCPRSALRDFAHYRRVEKQAVEEPADQDFFVLQRLTLGKISPEFLGDAPGVGCHHVGLRHHPVTRVMVSDRRIAACASVMWPTFTPFTI